MELRRLTIEALPHIIHPTVRNRMPAIEVADPISGNIHCPDVFYFTASNTGMITGIARLEMCVVSQNYPTSVLVVEDDPSILMDAIAILQEQQFNVYEARDAKAAIELLENTPAIDVLFTDIDMPGSMDGLALAFTARQRWPSMGIILTSGHRWDAAANFPDRSIFMSKPYIHETVVDQIRQMSKPVLVNFNH